MLRADSPIGYNIAMHQILHFAEKRLVALSRGGGTNWLMRVVSEFRQFRCEPCFTRLAVEKSYDRTKPQITFWKG
jgi:hypothetical protein